eukprot:GILJ01033444.1.p1 GENE.GILJ01033444.1~~GILJ01033444.1.p1  ORF type:complete len:158 (+),score=8.50 GILJ01033444.1:80-553(+)
MPASSSPSSSTRPHLVAPRRRGSAESFELDTDSEGGYVYSPTLIRHMRSESEEEREQDRTDSDDDWLAMSGKEKCKAFWGQCFRLARWACCCCCDLAFLALIQLFPNLAGTPPSTLAERRRRETERRELDVALNSIPMHSARPIVQKRRRWWRIFEK